jgi:hypothetical protein
MALQFKGDLARCGFELEALDLGEELLEAVALGRDLG